MITNSAYQTALDYLYSFINYESKLPPSPEHAQFNLRRLRLLLDHLGNPQQCWPSVVIAGTKGKGSTAAMIEAMLRAAGVRTGLFSSPHMHTWRERVQVDRRLISQDDVVRLVELLREQVSVLGQEVGLPTTFELATALAFVYFAEQKVDLAVLEVGMGGRYDTVNVVTPCISAITPISYDHMQILGTTLSEIANAKAGIIKPQVPVVSAVQQPAAAAVIAAAAESACAPLWLATPAGLRSSASTFSSARPYLLSPTEATINLFGAHQIENACVALGVLDLLNSVSGIEVTATAAAAGLRTVQWPGRCEILARAPTILLDGAMNGASAARLREVLTAVPHRRLLLVLGTSSDKDVAAIARELVPSADAVIITRSRHPRSAPFDQVHAGVAPFTIGDVHATDDIPEALALAHRLAEPDDLICVTGSLFVVAAAREALGYGTDHD